MRMRWLLLLLVAVAVCCECSVLCPPGDLGSPSQLATLSSFPPDIDFAELNQKLKAGEVMVIDVRQPHEYHTLGAIPKSKKMSLLYLGLDILLPEDEFLAKFKFEKPVQDDPMVVYCTGGVRARTAQLAMHGAGYTNVRVYTGSFQDWVDQGGELEFP